MGGSEDSNKRNSKSLEMENLSLDISASSRFSRDLLQRFRGSANKHGGAEEEDEKIELNLGLSMGGRFGVDKNSNKLVRSSSTASCLPESREDNDAAAAAAAESYTGLVRTSSLPVETEEEWRKRKELQSLRRMEAKRRRSEKQRNLKSESGSGGSGGGWSGSGGGGSLSAEEKKEIEVNLRARLDREKSLSSLKRTGSGLASQIGFPAWAAATHRSGGVFGSQGSVESKGGSSSTVSDLESKNLQGSSGELSPASIQSAAGNQDVGSSATKATSKSGGPDMDSPSKAESSRSRGKDSGANPLEDMPCVFTKGDGPNGRRVDGILYKYGKGEDVRIMCVCHGSFHSPADFVRHAGGTDVDNPLKHIVVNPNSPSLV
ncbi:hypothetical protein ACS0TY_009871 [Phlomoides rotata]